MDELKLTPWNLFLQSAVRYEQQICVVDKDTIFTYGEMLDKINRFETIIKQIDFKICGIYLPNSSMFICSMLTLNKMNKIMVPLSFQLKGESLRERINFSDMEVIITDSKGLKEIEEIQDSINIKAVILMEGYKIDIIDEFSYSFKTPQLETENIFGVCFTSGSTSTPKAVVISNSSIAGNALAVADYFKFQNFDRFLITRSFTQAGPISGDILMPLSQGGSIVILSDLFYPAIFLKAVQQYKVTTTLLVSTTLSQLLKYPQINKYDISSLKRIIFGGMTTPKSIIEEALIKIPEVGLYNTYGLTEACTKVSFLGPEEISSFPRSVGRTIKGCKVKIIKEDGKEAEAGEVGEIFIETDYIADGYYKQEKLTAETMTPRGLRTRDMGYIDENGLLYIVGRNDDLIIQGGNNVYPIEIEEVLLRNEEIKEAVVFGVDDIKLGSKIIAVITVVEGSEITVQQIYKWCRGNLEDKKTPKEIYIIENIPKNTFGKISKVYLKQYINNLILVGGNK